MTADAWVFLIVGVPFIILITNALRPPSVMSTIVVLFASLTIFLTYFVAINQLLNMTILGWGLDPLARFALYLASVIGLPLYFAARLPRMKISNRLMLSKPGASVPIERIIAWSLVVGILGFFAWGVVEWAGIVRTWWTTGVWLGPSAAIIGYLVRRAWQNSRH